MSTSNKVIRFTRHVAQYKSSMYRSLTNTPYYDELHQTSYRQLNTNRVDADLYGQLHQRRT